jgi:hypothetical protein
MADLGKAPSRPKDDETMCGGDSPDNDNCAEIEKIFVPMEQFDSHDAEREGRLSRPRTKTSSLRTLSRMRSNNGYGCDDMEESEDTELDEDTDPFIVGWDDGDNDPLCPRSMSLARKWLAVLVCAMSALCV